MNKKLLIICIVLCIASVAGYRYSERYSHRDALNEAPVIAMDSKDVTVSVYEPEKAVLKGITAVDAEDGDVTDSLVVESMGNLVNRNYRNVSIAAFDSSGNVSKIQRRVHYSNYREPRFRLEAPLMAPASNISSVLEGITARDVLDGDLTEQIQISCKSTITNGVTNTYPVNLMVSNSAGDTVDLPVTLTAYNAGDRAQAPVITLTDYLIYVDKDSEFKGSKYLESVTIKGRTWIFDYKEKAFHLEDGEQELGPREEPLTAKGVSIGSKAVDTSVPGVYECTYTVKEYAENPAGVVRLIVIVKE